MTVGPLTEIPLYLDPKLFLMNPKAAVSSICQVSFRHEKYE